MEIPRSTKGFSLALPQGECFGMLGPNGAGKSTSISMMIGLTLPTSGTAFIQGLDIRTEMNRIYTSMGVCPQHNLLWERLTGREHLLFYGRLKNLKGAALTEGVGSYSTAQYVRCSLSDIDKAHSMEEAEVLCNWLGIFVVGRF
ncbi:hypothetical protein IFM89_022390 [Coptis chinensis]|uniref:ABC transporter domain-containing protein n=1 Tax=Coptis chinensis TaxID=261450 RepID=A0A835MAI1_9MAGN|nr:hypothetical protein IFM89_022390 [Coptis chinensis]